MSRTTVVTARGKIWLRQMREGHEQRVALTLHEVDAIVAWIRSARAEQERRRVIRKLRRRIRKIGWGDLGPRLDARLQPAGPGQR